MPERQVLKAPLLKVNIEPRAFRVFAQDFYEAYKNHKTTAKFSAAKYSLICMAIESAAKALHSDQGMHWKDIRKQYKHDLIRVCNKKILAKYGLRINKQEKKELKKANRYHTNKGFEYFLFESKTENDAEKTRKEDMLIGYPDHPDLAMLEYIIEKLLSVELKNS